MQASKQKFWETASKRYLTNGYRPNDVSTSSSSDDDEDFRTSSLLSPSPSRVNGGLTPKAAASRSLRQEWLSRHRRNHSPSKSPSRVSFSPERGRAKVNPDPKILSSPSLTQALLDAEIDEKGKPISFSEKYRLRTQQLIRISKTLEQVKEEKNRALEEIKALTTPRDCSPKGESRLEEEIRQSIRKIQQLERVIQSKSDENTELQNALSVAKNKIESLNHTIRRTESSHKADRNRWEKELQESNESKDSIQTQLKVAQDQLSKIKRNFSDSRSSGETWKELYEEQTQILMDQDEQIAKLKEQHEDNMRYFQALRRNEQKEAAEKGFIKNDDVRHAAIELFVWSQQLLKHCDLLKEQKHELEKQLRKKDAALDDTKMNTKRLSQSAPFTERQTIYGRSHPVHSRPYIRTRGEYIKDWHSDLRTIDVTSPGSSARQKSSLETPHINLDSIARSLGLSPSHSPSSC